MSELTKTITYKIPNERYGTDDSEGKTSTHTYVGPSHLMLFMDKETHMVKEVQDMDNLCEQPTPLDFYELVLDCDESVENCIRCTLIGPVGYDKPKVYEVAVGPENQKNNVIKDPTHISEVYDQNSVAEGYNGSEWADLTYETGRCGDDFPNNEWGRDNWNMEFIRGVRNDDLEASDAATSEDMPDSIKQKWIDYRQQLRDLPNDWDGVPADLIVIPQAPDEADARVFADPDVDVIIICDRTGDDDVVVAQLPNNVN